MGSFYHRPTIIAALLDQIDFLPAFFANISRKKTTSVSIEGEPPGVAKPVSPNFPFGIRLSHERIVRRDHVMRAPTAAHVEGFIEQRVSRLVDEEARESRRRGYEPVPVGENLPAFASVMTDALDHLWVEEFEPPGEELPGVLWSVFDPDGQILGFVETPEELEVYEIGEDYILGRVMDELEVEFIQLWTLERLGG